MNKYIEYIKNNKRGINQAYSSLLRFQEGINDGYIHQLQLFNYCLGKGISESFCNFIEKETGNIGHLEQYSNYKYGVFFSKQNDDYKYLDIYENEDIAFKTIKDFLILNLESSKSEKAGLHQDIKAYVNIPTPFKNKIVYLFHPWKILPIYDKRTLLEVLEYAGYSDLLKQEDLLEINMTLTKYLINDYSLGELYTENAEKAILGLYFFLETTLNLGKKIFDISFCDNLKDIGLNLIKNDWDDFGYETTYDVNINEGFSKSFIYIGHTRIIGNNPDIKNTEDYKIEFPCKKLGSDFCSFANNSRFYIELKELLGSHLSHYILTQLNDLILKEQKFIDQFKDLDIFFTSLLRDQGGNTGYIQECKAAYDNANTIEDDYQILGYGRIKEDISYSNGKKSRLVIDFDFTENKFGFYRIHGIIGKNGIGKTTTLYKLAKLLSSEDTNNENSYHYRTSEIDRQDTRMQDGDILYFARSKEGIREDSFSSPKNNFSKIIGISYEAFGDSDGNLFSFLNDTRDGICCGGGSLKEKIERMKFEKSNFFKEKVKEVFESEDINEIDIQQIFENPEYADQLSSGYKVLLGTVTDIVMHIKPNSLILFDEPETHLHPEFVSNLINILYTLLDEFKSYMIIGTHSPIIIQQIPSKYITKIIDNGDRVVAKGLEIESFGNSLTEIIYDVFSGEQEEVFYKKKILQLKADGVTIDELYDFLGDKISLNLKIYIDTIYSE